MNTPERRFFLRQLLPLGAILGIIFSACVASAHAAHFAFLETKEIKAGWQDGLWRTLPLSSLQWQPVERATPATDSPLLPESAPLLYPETTPGDYLVLGLEYILQSVDHLFFLLLLLFLVKGWRQVAATLAAFSVAHSLTLTAAAFGLVQVPEKPVTAVIALSIVLLAAEIVYARQGRPGIITRAPWMAAFAFGWLHGLGFANAITNVGLPQDFASLALLFYNVGIELGQIGFVCCALLLITGVRHSGRFLSTHSPTWGWRLPPYTIGSVAIFWLMHRLAGI